MKVTTYDVLAWAMAALLSLGLAVGNVEDARAAEQAAPAAVSEPSLGAKTWKVMKQVGEKAKEVGKETAEAVGQTAKQVGRSVKDGTVEVVDKTGEMLQDSGKTLQNEPKE